MHGIKYSSFINGLKKINLHFNRKVLADLAAQEPDSLKKLWLRLKQADILKQMKTTDQLIHSAYADLTSCATIESLEKIRIKYFQKMDLLPNYLNSSHLSLLKRKKK